MGLLNFITAKTKPYDAAAAEARVKTLESILPAGADIELTEPSKGQELEYLIEIVGDRARTSALLTSIVEVVAEGAEKWSVDFTVRTSADESSTYSSIDLPRQSAKYLDVLLRAHDELYAVNPDQTIYFDATDGSFTVSEVPRDKALATAQIAVRAWEGIVTGTDNWWDESTMAVEVGVGIGADGESAEIIYSSTVERDPDVMGRNRTASGTERVTDAEWAQRVFAAWNHNLPALEALLRLPVPADHEAEISFSSAELKPRLTVAHHMTYDRDKSAAKDLVATIRDQVTDSKLKAR